MAPSVFWLAAMMSPLAATDAGAVIGYQDPRAPGSPDQTSPAPEASNGDISRKKAAVRPAIAKKKTDRSRTSKKRTDRDTGLIMDPGIVCKSIDGFEDYERLPGAAQTSDEKLLVYIRTYGFQVEKVDKSVEAHLTADGEVRKRGQKAILRQKKKMLDYRPRAAITPERVYLKASISLKGLAPGDYDLTIILHDEIAKDSSVSQVIKFKVIPPKDPRQQPEGRQPQELDSLYAPFLYGLDPDEEE
jgi:hypothetical protein